MIGKKEKKGMRTLAIVLTISILTLQVQPVQAAQNSYTFREGVYEIISTVNQNYSLDISGGSTEEKANVQLWTRNGTQAQRFWIASAGADLFYIKNAGSGKVIDAQMGGTASGTNLWQWRRNGSSAQLFRLNKVGENTYEILNAESGHCLDLSNGEAKRGGNVQLWRRNGTPAQRWILRLISPGKPPAEPTKTESATPVSQQISGGQSAGKTTQASSGGQSAGADSRVLQNESTLRRGLYEVISVLDESYCLDIAGGSKDKRASAQIWSRNGSLAQRFFLQPKGSVYTIQNAGSEIFLDAADGGKQKGTDIWQWPGNGSPAQQFRIYAVGNGTYEIQNVGNGLYLDVSNGKAARGTNVQLWTENHSPAQRWIIRRVSGYKPGAKAQSVKDIIAALEKANSQKSISGFGGYSPSLAKKTELQKAMNVIEGAGFKVGYIMIDIDTLRGISYQTDIELWSASTVKGPYIVSLVKSNPSLLEKEKGRISSVLTYSHNENYRAMVGQYGKSVFNNWCKTLNSTITLPSWSAYTNYTPRELAKLWAGMFDYFEGSGAGENLGRMFENPETSPIRSALSKGGTITRTKAGWYYSGPLSEVANDAGIVYENGKPYLMAIMTNAKGNLYLLQPLSRALSAIHQEMVGY